MAGGLSDKKGDLSLLLFFAWKLLIIQLITHAYLVRRSLRQRLA
jgi:hypothetical protein